MTKTKKLTTSAVLIALAFVLVMVSKMLPAPWTAGGSITIGSMVPIILISVILGTKWGLLSGFVFALIQMMTGFYVPPAATFWSFLAVVLLDYVFAFGVLGLAGFFVKITGNKAWSMPLGALIVTFLRYVMHIFSGILIWGRFAETANVLVYSVVYNGSYMIPEIIITTIIVSLISPKIKEKFNR